MEQNIEILESDFLVEKKREDREPVSWFSVFFNIFFSTGVETNKEKET
jgi:hypothetical protein